jgi:PIN domain nuclease of toxin-antitoxin system
VKLLLDTHAFLWFLAGESRVKPRVRRRIEDTRNEKLLSVASIWEMAIKVSLRKLELDDPLPALVAQSTRDVGIGLLGISAAHATGAAQLPWHHRDPFDRLLVSQALSDELTIVSADESFDAYGVDRLW